MKEGLVKQAGWVMPIDGRGRGAPPKDPKEKYLKKRFSVPPDLWAEVEARIPERLRSRFICEAIAAHLEKGDAAE